MPLTPIASLATAARTSPAPRMRQLSRLSSLGLPAQAGSQFINPRGLYDPAPNGYSHVVVSQLPARLVHVAGQGGENAAGELVPDFATQVRQALDNLQTALAAADASLAEVVKLTVLVVDHDESRLALLAEALREAWCDRPAPACTLVPVARLALDGMLFEIEATAVTPGGRGAHYGGGPATAGGGLDRVERGFVPM